MIIKISLKNFLHAQNLGDIPNFITDYYWIEIKKYHKKSCSLFLRILYNFFPWLDCFWDILTICCCFICQNNLSKRKKHFWSCGLWTWTSCCLHFSPHDLILILKRTVIRFWFPSLFDNHDIYALLVVLAWSKWHDLLFLMTGFRKNSKYSHCVNV